MKNIQTVYDHIRSNNIKTTVLVALFPVFFCCVNFLVCMGCFAIESGD